MTEVYSFVADGAYIHFAYFVKVIGLSVVFALISFCNLLSLFQERVAQGFPDFSSRNSTMRSGFGVALEREAAGVKAVVPYLPFVMEASRAGSFAGFFFFRERIYFSTKRLATISRQRPYHVETTGSRPITEVKQRRARSVLGWVTAWEHRVPLASPFLLLLRMIEISMSIGRELKKTRSHQTHQDGCPPHDLFGKCEPPSSGDPMMRAGLVNLKMLNFNKYIEIVNIIIMSYLKTCCAHGNGSTKND
jgi:hypothetical protein